MNEDRKRSSGVDLTDFERDELFLLALKSIKKGEPMPDSVSETFGKTMEGKVYAFLEINAFIEEGPYGKYKLTDKGEKRLKDGFVQVRVKELKDQKRSTRILTIISAVTLIVALASLAFTIYGLFRR